MKLLISVALAATLFIGVSIAVPFHMSHSLKGGSMTRLLDLQVSHLSANEAHLLRDVPAQYFYQKLDHFNPSDDTVWSQKYYINSTYWKGDGYPIFFMIGGEGPIDGRYVTSLDYVLYAKTYNALLITLEHRFYGESIPTADLSDANMKYLSSQQALADLANFRQAITKDLNAPNSKWITFGGSYPGCLSAWARLKYPHLFAGSISTSGPVLAELNFVQYLEVVEASLTYFGGSSCPQAIQQATNQIQTMLTTSSGKSQVQSLFKVCAPLQSDDDIANFMSTLAGNIMGVVQYNNEGRGGPNIDDICAGMVGSDPLSAYVNVSNALLAESGASCLDVSYTSMINQMKNATAGATVGGRSWLWQTCQEFGYYQSTDSNSSHVFGNLFPLAFSLKICNDVFGTSYSQQDFQDRIDWSNTYYGDLNFAGSNTFFIHGTIDPWHALGITEDVGPTNPADLITGTAHCANMRMPLPTDPAPLVAARLRTAQQLDFWI